MIKPIITLAFSLLFFKAEAAEFSIGITESSLTVNAPSSGIATVEISDQLDPARWRPWKSFPVTTGANLLPAPPEPSFLRSQLWTAIQPVPLNFTFNAEDFQIRNVSWKESPYFEEAPFKLPDQLRQDAFGVRQYFIDGAVYDHPVLQGLHGLSMINSYFLTTNSAYLDRALLHGQRLIDTATVTCNAWFFPYRYRFPLDIWQNDWMEPVWYSGMAQGVVLSLFVHLYEITGDPKYQSAAGWVFNSFKLHGANAAGPWFVATTEDGDLWFEEYAQDAERGDFVFNGHMFSLWGLSDYFRLTGDADALRLLKGAVTTIKNNLDQLRNPGFYASYCIRHHHQKPVTYQNIHTYLIASLYSLTGDITFAKAADDLLADAPAYATGVASVSGGVNGFKFGTQGDVLETVSDLFTETIDLPITSRERIKDQAGIWLKVGGTGKFAGFFIPEQHPLIYLKGMNQIARFSPERKVLLPPGLDFKFYEFNSNGEGTVQKVRYFPTPFPTMFDARASINSKPFVRISDGEFEGLWVPYLMGTVFDE